MANRPHPRVGWKLFTLITAIPLMNGCEPDAITAPAAEPGVGIARFVEAPPPGSVPNNAVLLNGAGAFVEARSNLLGDPQTVTVESWVKVGDSGRTQFIVSNTQSDFNNGFSLLLGTDNRVVFTLIGGPVNKASLTSVTALELDTWYHASGVYDSEAAVARLYINGLEEASVDYTGGIFYPGSQGLRFGGQVKLDNQRDRFLNGAVDEVRIWLVARSAEEIQENMDVEIEPDQPGLVGYWRMNEGEGSVAADIATPVAEANGQNDGTLLGDADWTEATWRQSNHREVEIAITPFRSDNKIGPFRCRIPVAILSSDGFDAPSDVDRFSLRFGATGDEESLLFKRWHGDVKPRCYTFDVNWDGLRDLTCKFGRQASGLEPGDTEAILKGHTLDGVAVMGTDEVEVIEKRRWRWWWRWW